MAETCFAMCPTRVRTNRDERDVPRRKMRGFTLSCGWRVSLSPCVRSLPFHPYFSLLPLHPLEYPTHVGWLVWNARRALDHVCGRSWHGIRGPCGVYLTQHAHVSDVFVGRTGGCGCFSVSRRNRAVFSSLFRRVQTVSRSHQNLQCEFSHGGSVTLAMIVFPHC